MKAFIGRREFITLLGGAAAAWPFVARAQQAPMPSIGVLSPVSAATSGRNIAALRQGLRNLGYVEGRNIAMEYRFAEGISERLSKFATELVALKPVVIVVGSTSGKPRPGPTCGGVFSWPAGLIPHRCEAANGRPDRQRNQ